MTVRSAVSVTAEVLREEILGREAGDWLGSEDEVLGRLGVSRPTLRQAARILEAEELLVVKRGINGGLFGRRPTSDAVARMASVVLRAEGTTLLDVAQTWFMLSEQSARLAAANSDRAQRQELVDLASQLRKTPQEAWFTTYDTSREFDARLAQLSGSPTLALFSNVLATLIRETGLVAGSAEIYREWTRQLEQAAKAILDGDGARAAGHVRKLAAMITDWIVEHVGSGEATWGERLNPTQLGSPASARPL